MKDWVLSKGRDGWSVGFDVREIWGRGRGGGGEEEGGGEGGGHLDTTFRG